MKRREFFGYASQAALVAAIPTGIAGAMLTAEPPKPDHVWDSYRECCICCGVTKESYIDTGSSLECEGFTVMSHDDYVAPLPENFWRVLHET